MKSILLPLHLVFVGLWLGCVLTEALFERALLGKGRAQESILASLHRKVDILVEIPAFLGVLMTGALMLGSASPNGLLQMKIGFGVLAILANAYCVWLVFRRSAHAARDEWQAFERIDHLQHKVGALVLLGILGALGSGLYMYTHA